MRTCLTEELSSQFSLLATCCTVAYSCWSSHTEHTLGQFCLEESLVCLHALSKQFIFTPDEGMQLMNWKSMIKLHNTFHCTTLIDKRHSDSPPPPPSATDVYHQLKAWIRCILHPLRNDRINKPHKQHSTALNEIRRMRSGFHYMHRPRCRCRWITIHG